jgi:hypothetical protein
MSAKFELIDAEKAEFPVAKTCEWMEVSTSGYYEWRNGPVLPNVSSAANWNIVPGQRRVRESPGLGYATDRVVKTNDLTWGNVLPGAWGHVRELRAHTTPSWSTARHQ